MALVITLSLTPPAPLPALPDGSDKAEHLLAYFVLSAGAVQVFVNRRWHLVLAVALASMGVALEFAQGAFTADRMQDGWDAVANTCGALAGLATSWMPLRDGLLEMESRGE